MAELKWTSEAELALREIYDHIARNRPATAQRTAESILNKIESLREAPTLGQPYRHRNVRRLTYGQFQIAYLYEDGSDVVVLGVFHGLIFLPLQ
ncbi:MAG: type II toxin-antitoxin system RelE/ParE family toxin [Acidobacteriota bacterium]